MAAKYGNKSAAEMMLNKGKEVNLWGLDNLGRTAARVAAISQKAECCRFLDTLDIRCQAQNPDYVRKMQMKAMKELAKRVEKDAKAAHKDEYRDPKRRVYSHATAPSREWSESSSDMKSSSATQLISGRRKKNSTQADVLRQNFELRPSSSADHIDKETTLSTPEEDEGGVLRPAGVKTGPLLNNLKSLTSESYIPTTSTSRHSSGSGQGVPDIMLSSQPIVIENDSPLATFLQSLDLIDHIQLLHREKLDLEALALCEEKDLAEIGLPLGPRKKILNAIKRRQTLLKKPGRMVDTEL